MQAHFDPTIEHTESYCLESAAGDRLILGRDYLLELEAADPVAAPHLNVRRTLFGTDGEYGLRDMMAFALISPRERRIDDPKQLERAWEVTGIVTLHDHGNAAANNNAGFPLGAWPRGWAPVVAHVQTYLPYVLMQVEALHNPLDDARRYLLHSGRTELNGVLEKITGLRGSLHALLDPDGYVQQTLTRLGRRADQHQPIEASDLTRVLDAIRLVSESALHLSSNEFERNLSTLTQAMQDYRDIASLGIEFDTEGRWFDLREALEGEVQKYQSAFKVAGIYTSVDTPPGIRVWLPKFWWGLLVGDLVHNAAKYASSDRAFSIKFERAKSYVARLVFENAATYVPRLDDELRLLKFGVRGSAGMHTRLHAAVPRQPINRQGQGIGLWGIATLCKVMGIQFSIDIQRHKNQGEKDELSRAIYRFILTFPSGVIETRGEARRQWDH